MIKKYALPELPIPAGAINWLMVSLALSIGWHIQHVTPWAVVGAFLFGIYIYTRIIKEKSMPPKFLRIALTLAAVVGIVLTYRSYLGRDPGITALILLSTMKLAELEHRRDFMFVVFLCYFIVFGNFLYDQSIEDLAFTLLAAILITATLLRLNHPETGRVKKSWLMRFSLRLILYALPFTIMLFFLFPRTTGPLWNISQEATKRWRSGFNDTVEPGQIANLAQSKLPAFKVEFPDGTVPEPKDLYFRGLVLWFTDGKRWVQGVLPARSFFNATVEGPSITQQITLEPHNQRFLFGLDRPVIVPRWSRILPGNIFQTRFPVKGHYRYRVVSQLTPVHKDDLSERHRRWSLSLPRNINDRIYKLGKQWREQTSSVQEILKLAKDYFKNSDFVYTLNPGLMDSREPIEDFLFNERRGFCEHYASAFTMLMRAAHVPARMVLGYQGGEFNPVGEYLLVRQSDAHAWTEVYLEDQGWLRVDPTAWSAPERIEYGFDVSQSIANLGNLDEADRSSAIQNALQKGFLGKIADFIKHHWDNINYKWDVWIISYDRFRQRDFFKSIGMENIKRTTLLLATIILVPLFFFIISWLLKRRSLTTDPLIKLYRRFCTRMEKKGVQRLRWEGPVDFQLRACQKVPEKTEIIKQITSLFVQLRYGPASSAMKSHMKQLKKYIAKL